MARIYSIALGFTLVVIAIAGSAPAHAVQRTHVSAAFGSDSNTASNCTAAAPCRFFQAAMTVTDTNGEVIVLDSGGYGAVTITKSVSLTAPTGVYAGISVFPGANGVTIATAGVNVVLRGLTINGQGGNNGISMTAGNRLTVENCVVSNLALDGIYVNTAATVRVTDSIVRDNGEGGIFLLNGARATITRAVVSGNVAAYGVYLFGSVPGLSTADIADSTIDGNGTGVFAASVTAAAIVKLSLRDSRIVRNADFGVIAQSTSGPASVYATNNIVSNNATGITAFGSGSKLIASGNTVTGNQTAGLQNSGGVFESAGNNTVRDNGANTGTITAVATQ